MHPQPRFGDPRPARRLPVQDRAKVTVERLLDALGAHLAEHGFRGLTTNAIASRAGLGVATLYAYFPNIITMLEAYAERSLAKWNALWEQWPAFRPADDWRNAYRRSVQATLEHARQDYGYVLLINAFMVVPELDEVLGDIRRRHVLAAVEIFETAGLSLPRPKMEAIAATVIDAGWNAVLHLTRKPDELLAQEYERRALAYLANYLSAACVDPPTQP